MKRSVAYCWGLLCHKLEIELIRVGEPIRVRSGKFLGVTHFKMRFGTVKIISNFLYRDGRDSLNSPRYQLKTPPYTISMGTLRE
jgi:hypothetical protein